MDNNTLNLINEDINIKLQATLLTLLLEYREIKEFSLINKLEILKEVHSKIGNAICILDEINYKPISQKNDLIAEMESCRSKILNIAEKITHHFNVLKQLNSSLQQFNSNNGLKDKLDTDINSLINYCEQFIHSNESENVINKIILCFPFRMPEDEYEDYVYNNLIVQLDGLFKCEVDCIIQRYKASVNPQIYEQYKFYLNNVYELIIELQNMDFALLNEEQIFEYNIKIFAAYEEFEEMFGLLDTLFTITNSILILFNFNHVSNVDLIEGNYIYKDLYYSVKESISNSDYLLEEAIDESLTSNCEDIINKFNTNLLETEKYLGIKNNKNVLMQNNDFKLKYTVCKIIQAVFVKALENSLYEKSFAQHYFSFELADKDYLNIKISELLKYISEKKSEVLINKKGIALSTMRIYLNKEKLLSYIYNAFKNIADKNEKDRIIINLLNLFASCNFAPQNMKFK